MLAPQLAFNGTCRAAFTFYARLLDGEIAVMNSFGGNEAHALPDGSSPLSADAIRFAELRFDGGVLRGNDVGADAFVPMRGFSLSLHLRGADKAERVFHALAEGGTVVSPLAEVDWAERFGMVTDRFGVPWLVLALKPDAR